VYEVSFDEVVVGGSVELECEEDVDDPGSDPDVDPTDRVVPDGTADRRPAPVAAPAWKTMIPARSSTTMTGTAPSAMGRTLSDVRFIPYGGLLRS